jgi:uncharacterized protein YkwD
MNLSNLHANWVDLIIILILAYFLSDSWKLGFWVVLTDFLGFLLSLITALFGYSFASSILQESFSLPRSIANALGFLFIAGMSEAVLSFILASITEKIPYKFWKKPWSNIMATFPALGQGVILVAFLLTLVMSLPIIPKVKSDINESQIGGILLEKTSRFEAQINEIFGGILEDSLTYLTVKPGSQESIPLDIDKQGLSVDEAAEAEMFNSVNEERKKRGINELSLRSEVIPVARRHATDMWERRYFGHVSPDGEDVGDRLNNAGVVYSVAGENLALAPTIQTAHNGLMNSEGHRKNILDPEFKRLGIGVIDNGVYGKMFVQIFTD